MKVGIAVGLTALSNFFSLKPLFLMNYVQLPDADEYKLAKSQSSFLLVSCPDGSSLLHKA